LVPALGTDRNTRYQLLVPTRIAKVSPRRQAPNKIVRNPKKMWNYPYTKNRFFFN